MYAKSYISLLLLSLGKIALDLPVRDPAKHVGAHVGDLVNGAGCGGAPGWVEEAPLLRGIVSTLDYQTGESAVVSLPV